MKKNYLALVEGKPEPAIGEYRWNLLRDRRSGRMKSVEMGGKDALTRYRVLKTWAEPGQASLVELELVTGRTHQIRAHLSEAGHPLLGDVRYGGRTNLDGLRFDRQCLHARRLEIEHPRSGERLSFQAEMPPDMLKLS
jgi:23S rRNA pseudouridine1911/1915/1917 synthase